MSGWLSDECRAELREAGYIAVPKECVREFHAETQVDEMDMLYRRRMNASSASGDGFDQAILHRQAAVLATELMKEGFIDIEVFEPAEGEPPYFRHRASIYVLRPRTIKGAGTTY